MELMVATAGLLLLHVPPGIGSDKVTQPAPQIWVGPMIGGVPVFTLTTTVAEQPVLKV
jgi:hypothetical protein